MSIGSAVSAAIKNPTVWKAGAAIAGGVGLAVTLAACSKTDPNDFARREFGDFDKNGDGKIDLKESRQERTETRTRTRETGRVNLHNGYDFVTGYKQRYEQDYVKSVEKLVGAAGKDGEVTFDQIAQFAISNFDMPNRNGVKDGVLGEKEISKFRREYGVRDEKVGSERELERWHFTTTEKRWDHYDYDHGPVYRPTDPGPVYRPTDPGPVYDRGSDVDPGPVYQPTR